MIGKKQILEACCRLIQENGTRGVSLDTAAKAVGLTKPGLMYHFPTKEALVIGIVDFVATELETSLAQSLGKWGEEATPTERMRAYVDHIFSDSLRGVGFAVYADAAYRPAANAAWKSRMEKWFEMPHDLPIELRNRLNLARLAADGLWMAQETNVFDLSNFDRAELRSMLLGLLEQDEVNLEGSVR